MNYPCSTIPIYPSSLLLLIITSTFQSTYGSTPPLPTSTHESRSFPPSTYIPQNYEFISLPRCISYHWQLPHSPDFILFSLDTDILTLGDELDGLFLGSPSDSISIRIDLVCGFLFLILRHCGNPSISGLIIRITWSTDKA